MDPTERQTTDVNETRAQYDLHELAEILDAPIDEVRVWLHEENVDPVSNEEPEVYDADTLELIRGRRQMV